MAHVAFVDRLAQCFTTVSELVEAHILAEMISGGDTFGAYRFEADAVILDGLVASLRSQPSLWIDFQQAVEGLRQSSHWTRLLEHVYGIGTLHGQLWLLQQGLSCPSEDDRCRLAAYLNGLDGEIAARQDRADRRGLAARVNQAAGYPLIDGLTLRGLTYVLGEDPELWLAFRLLVGVSADELPRRCPLTDAQA
jgi:hypothetical protein